MIRLHCLGGARLDGKNTPLIAKKHFGVNAIYKDRQDSNDPALGYILVPTGAAPRQYFVVATVMEIEVINDDIL